MREYMDSIHPICISISKGVKNAYKQSIHCVKNPEKQDQDLHQTYI